MTRKQAPPQRHQKPIVNRPRQKPAQAAILDPGTVAAERKRDALAYDLMRLARPMKPPPLPRWNDTRTAAGLALAAEIREGTYSR